MVTTTHRTDSWIGLDSLNLRLDPHAISRNKAVAKIEFIPGSIVAVAQPLTTALLPVEKEQRCDLCHNRPQHNGRLLKCTGCASHWYCDVQCQGVAWKAHHRKICGSYSRFIASPAYVSLSVQDKMDSLLLSQLCVEILPSDPSPHQPSPLAIFESLIPSRSPPQQLPPMLVRLNSLDAWNRLLDLYSRFGNNNFVLHSHLVSFGHGIYPLASRLLNHSCVPNAAVRYSLMQGRPPSMEVIALRTIAAGEEVCIPYVDPALPFGDRERALNIIYGFSCSCPLCQFQRAIAPLLSDRDISPQNRQHLLEFTQCLTNVSHTHQDTLQDFSEIPASLHSLFHPSVLPRLAESFSSKSHGSAPESALDDGLTLLALYRLIYPPNYPQIGLHALEAAKTAWNALLSKESRESAYDKQLLELAIWYLGIARHVVGIVGKEGDAGGPLAEIDFLSELINKELSTTA
ncbi:SET domain-containing protein [Lactarius pseudohatsudake]|nr:SET domain-containing protein [Lactarius pseudohatsudake]